MACRLAQWTLERWGERGGIREMGNWVSLPVLIVVISLLAFLSTPAFNAVSRHFNPENRETTAGGSQETQIVSTEQAPHAARVD